MTANYYVIFGARVKPDGGPSGTLRRRVEGAHRAARGDGDAWFLATGGQGEHGPPEAEVMGRLLLELGVPDERILREAAGHDTLSSVIECIRILRGRGDAGRVLVCSSPYHAPRCQLLFRLFGVPAVRADMPGDRAALGWGKWLYYLLREAAALPYDAALAILGGRGRYRSTGK
ncbi:MAG: YdcF family protein [Alphaproteobacteria bacterium]|nr:YdcF family protein [Alphaproteobacteria bacterium]MDP6565508.1 YdcF family protein [Alphaproteobacteria bacterium]MDP6816198.1 YdcF family protein [Alphaproteobacteria bacterium]